MPKIFTKVIKEIYVHFNTTWQTERQRERKGEIEKQREKSERTAAV